MLPSGDREQGSKQLFPVFLPTGVTRTVTVHADDCFWDRTSSDIACCTVYANSGFELNLAGR